MICFLFMLNKHTHRYKLTHNHQKCEFWIQKTSKRVNSSKSLFRKFDPKKILSLLIGKTKYKSLRKILDNIIMLNNLYRLLIIHNYSMVMITTASKFLSQYTKKKKK